PQLAMNKINQFDIFSMNQSVNNTEIKKEVQYKIDATSIPQIPSGVKFSGTLLKPQDYSPSILENKFNEISPFRLLTPVGVEIDQYVKVRVRKGRFLVSSWEHLGRVEYLNSPVSPTLDVAYKSKDEDYS
ncbi:hypothetical protein HK096_001326, partial [Nowakowskiella sp. JEL0078]